MELTLKEKKMLLNAVKEAIQSAFIIETKKDIDYCDYPNLMLNAGAFVTLRKSGNLRGCIGYIISNNTLFETIQDAARQAAFNDPRFPQLRQSELDEIEIEISVLSPPFKMESYDDIEIGKHGLILNDCGRRALLLPQVPVEYNMNRDEYLSALCEKACLYSDKWKEKQLDINLFTATVFSQEDVRREENAVN